MNRVQSDRYWYEEGRKTERKETINRVLEIIDDVNDEYMAWHGIIDIIRSRVKALKGEQE